MYKSLLASSRHVRTGFLATGKVARGYLVRQVQTKSISDLLDRDWSTTTNSDIELDKTEVRVVGWVKRVSDQKEVKFLHVADGASSLQLQLVCLPEKIAEKPELGSAFKSLTFNVAVEATGVLVKSSHPKQNVELQIHDLSVIGECDAKTYPFQAKTKYSLEQV
jgi:aspartyl/asparaginyl-tRNA synthetase